ncbi:MAG: hypothetical protein U9Q67_02805, partial [Patescibacteria group bacterium]|nr:hypothetical protein [Patescibacteria group bacterium]
NQDPDHYNKITLYKLPKGSSVPGPLMVEGKISEDTVMSQAMTYWGGKGSKVIEGNLITEPIGRAFLNIEPIYIESEHKGASIPQLKMVAVYYKDYALERETVGLGITLDDAMRRAIAGETVSFETLQKEREVISIRGLTNVTAATMKIEILDESGNIVETIEVLPGEKVISQIL